jgi:hypothetical protein
VSARRKMVRIARESSTTMAFNVLSFPRARGV